MTMYRAEEQDWVKNKSVYIDAVLEGHFRAMG